MIIGEKDITNYRDAVIIGEKDITNYRDAVIIGEKDITNYRDAVIIGEKKESFSVNIYVSSDDYNRVLLIPGMLLKSMRQKDIGTMMKIQ